MKEFIEKLICRLEERIFSAELYNDEFDGKTIDNLICLGDVTEIVNQLAEEYNNGWISVEDRLPEGKESHKVLVTDEDGIMAVCYFLEATKIFKVCWDGEEFQGVVAWQPLPPEYQPKGE